METPVLLWLGLSCFIGFFVLLATRATRRRSLEAGLSESFERQRLLDSRELPEVGWRWNETPRERVVSARRWSSRFDDRAA